MIYDSEIIVYETKQYEIFKVINGNRNIDKIHIKRLKESIQQKYLNTILVVNENYEIIDGQHRFNVLKEMNLPIRYVICVGYSLKEVQTYNAISNDWNINDYLDGYTNTGNIHYKKAKDFISKYKLNVVTSLRLLLGYNCNGNRLKNMIKYEEFKINDIDNAIKIAEYLYEISKYYRGYKRSAFIMALLNLSNNKRFSLDVFIRKLKLQQTRLVDCSKESEYIELIESIYNYKSHEKVTFKYSKKINNGQRSSIPIL